MVASRWEPGQQLLWDKEEPPVSGRKSLVALERCLLWGFSLHHPHRRLLPEAPLLFPGWVPDSAAPGQMCRVRPHTCVFWAVAPPTEAALCPLQPDAELGWGFTFSEGDRHDPSNPRGGPPCGYRPAGGVHISSPSALASPHPTTRPPARGMTDTLLLCRHQCGPRIFIPKSQLLSQRSVFLRCPQVTSRLTWHALSATRLPARFSAWHPLSTFAPCLECLRPVFLWKILLASETPPR